MTIHGDPEGTVTARLAELGFPGETTPDPAPAPRLAADLEPSPSAISPPAPPAPEPSSDTYEEPAEQTPEQPGDPYGTADFYTEFGLAPPEQVAAPPPPEDPDPEQDEPAAEVSEGQMTVEEVQPAADTGSGDASGSAQQPAAAAGAPSERDDTREYLTSADGRLRFTLLRIPDEGIAPEIAEGWQRTRDELAAAVETQDQQTALTPEQRTEQLAAWRRSYRSANRLEPFRPLPALRLTKREDAPGFRSEEYSIGSWVTWRDEQSGQQVTGQVMSPGAGKDTWYVSTDRTSVTGEYHVLGRSGKKAAGYTYTIGGGADLRPADGPGEQVPVEALPAVDSIPARPVTSYTDYVPANGLAMVREPIPVTVGEVGVRHDPSEVAFDVTANGILFVVELGRDDDSGAETFTPRVKAEDKVMRLGAAESRAEAVDTCVRVAREAREKADKPLYAQSRNNDLALAADGVCGQCSLHVGDNDVKELYRVNGGDPECVDHISLRLRVSEADVIELARARRIWATRVAPESASADEAAPPADAEELAEPPSADVAEQETAAAAPTPTEPHDIERRAIRPGDLITVAVEAADVEWPGSVPNEVPDQVTVTGTVYPGHLDYRTNACLLDAVIHDPDGAQVLTREDVWVQQLPTRVRLTPNAHRDDLHPETRTAGQLRMGDLIADGGRRGETVTEVSYANSGLHARRGFTTFHTRDVAKGMPNSFTLKNTYEVLVVPRERRPPQDVAAVFGEHVSHADAAAETMRTFELHAALVDARLREWPGDTGPQDEIRALDAAIGAIDPSGRGAGAYRANATVMTTAAAAAAALFDAVDDDVRDDRIGRPLHRLRQHLDVQIHRLQADIAHLAQRAQQRAAADEPSADDTTNRRAEEAPAEGAAEAVPDASEVQASADTPVGPGPHEQVTARFAQGDWVYYDGWPYRVDEVSDDGTVIHSPGGTSLPAGEAVREADMDPVTSERLADGWWRFSYRDRTYTATQLPDSLAKGRLASLTTVIVDEDNELVARDFNRPDDRTIIWAYTHPGVPNPHVARWLTARDDPSPLPEYTADERAYLEAGPPVEQTTLDLDNPTETQTAHTGVTAEPTAVTNGSSATEAEEEGAPSHEAANESAENPPSGPGADPGGQVPAVPETVEAIRRAWAELDDRRLVPVLRGEEESRVHASETTGYALIERPYAEVSRRWQVVAASNGRELEIGPSVRAGGFSNRDAAEQFARRLDHRFRAMTGRPFDWSAQAIERVLWRSPDGHPLARVLAQAAADFDRERGMYMTPAIRALREIEEGEQAPTAAQAGDGSTAETIVPAADAAGSSTPDAGQDTNGPVVFTFTSEGLPLSQGESAILVGGEPLEWAVVAQSSDGWVWRRNATTGEGQVLPDGTIYGRGDCRPAVFGSREAAAKDWLANYHRDQEHDRRVVEEMRRLVRPSEDLSDDELAEEQHLLVLARIGRGFYERYPERAAETARAADLQQETERRDRSRSEKAVGEPSAKRELSGDLAEANGTAVGETPGSPGEAVDVTDADHQLAVSPGNEEPQDSGEEADVLQHVADGHAADEQPDGDLQKAGFPPTAQPDTVAASGDFEQGDLFAGMENQASSTGSEPGQPSTPTEPEVVGKTSTTALKRRRPRKAATSVSGKRLGPAEPPVPLQDNGRRDSPGWLGVYGHAARGDCDRCGTHDVERFVTVWNWYGGDTGDMSAQCPPCTETTTRASPDQAREFADTADARRGGRLELGDDYAVTKGDVVQWWTGESEWTHVHVPTGKRYRTARESDSNYSGFVTRDLAGISYGVVPGLTQIHKLAERAALGRTAESHPSSGDHTAEFSYEQQLRETTLPDGEQITPLGRRKALSTLPKGPRWDMTVGDTQFVAEMIYLQGPKGADGHHLSVTGPNGAKTMHKSWDEVLEWARSQALSASEPAAEPALEAAAQPDESRRVEDTGASQSQAPSHDRSGGPGMDNPDPPNAPGSGADPQEITPVAAPEPRPREGEAYADQRAALVRSALADDRVQTWAAEHPAGDFAELFSTWLHNFVTTTAADTSTLREAFFGDPDRQEAFVSAATTEVYSVLQEAGRTPPEELPPAVPDDDAVTVEAPDRREERGGEAADTEDLALFTEMPSGLGSTPPESIAAPADTVSTEDQPSTPGTEPDEADEAFAGLVEAVEDHLPGDMDEGLKADLLGELDARWAETKAAWSAALGPDAKAGAGDPAEDEPTAGAVNRALREAQSTVADDQRASTSVEWRRISAVWEHTKRLRSWVEGVTVRWASGLLSDTRTHGFFHTVAARSCAAVASGALRLAGWLSPADTEGRTPSRTAQVLRRLSRVASSYSARLRGRPQDDVQTTAYDAISSELQALRDRSRAPSELTPYASPKEQEQAAIDVSRAFLRVRDGMGEFLLGDHPRTEAFRSVWKGLPKTDEQGAAAAALYRRVAQHADALGPVAARSGQHNDALTALRALAGAAALHADRLVATHGAPPSAGSAAGGRRPRQQAAPSAPAVTRGGAERSGGGVAAGR